MARVLVTDGEQRAALAVVRSLGRAGHEVMVCALKRASLAGASRYCGGRFVTADALAAPARFAEDVADAIAAARADVVIPITEAALAALLPLRETLNAALPFASNTVFNSICDKRLVLERAQALGIDVPRQQQADSVAELERVPEGMSFPFVIKPSRSVVADGERRVKTSVLHVADAASFARAIRSIPATAYPVLVQERIVGPGIGVFMLLSRGDVVAAFAHRRLREKPPSGGVSVYSESQPVDPALLERSRGLLAEFGWEGVAMVEYKIDQRSGTPYLMEINGRFWGSLQLAISAGVDFPALLVDVAMGGRPVPVRSFRTGIRSRWLMGDVDHLLTRMRRSAATLGLPPDAPGRVQVVRDFMAAFGRASRNEIVQWSDPAPAARELLDWVRPNGSS